MTVQLKIITTFCYDAKYHMVKFGVKNNEDFGKILTDNELTNLNLHKNEIFRSIGYKNGDMLFVYDLKPKEGQQEVDNSFSLLTRNLREARIIELVYSGIFRWVFDGVSIKAYAIIPSGDGKTHSTINRYGGIDMFIKILRQHLENIGKLHKGLTPDYDFLNNKKTLEDTEMSIGSVNNVTWTYSIGIDLKMDWDTIFKNSKDNIQTWQPINKLDMKYWAREINPDFIVEAKHIKLKNTMTLTNDYNVYPPCIKNIMALKRKGDYNRFILARFLLSMYTPRDAKFVYMSVLSEEEKSHTTTGDSSLQWNYILNNMRRYNCPSCIQLRRFCDNQCKLSHPLEDIQKTMENE